MRPILLLYVAVALAVAGSATAASFTVDRLDDAVDLTPGDALCAAPGGGCTLRAAVMEANALAGEDAIQMPLGTLRLTLTSGPSDQSFGDLDVDESVLLIGRGMRETVIAASTGDRVIEFHGGNSLLSTATVRGGVTSAGSGAGVLIQSSAILTCTSCLIRDNRSSGAGGGMMVAAGGHLEASGSIFAANASEGSGGGVFNQGIVALTDSRVTRNLALGSGGGLASTGASSSLALSRASVDQNDAAGSGGGVVAEGGSHSFFNSTLSGNRSGQNGGALRISGAASAESFETTIVANVAEIEGGGVWLAADSTLSAANTILADNVVASASSDCLGTITSSFGHNLIEDLDGCTLSGTLTGNVTGQDPGLLPLANYGGPTPTHELVSTDSPAWNAGDDVSCQNFDQRFHPRPRGTHCDIGATEFFGLVPLDLAMDPTGNGVFEPALGNAAVEPTIGNLLASTATLTGGLFLDGPSPTTVNYVAVDFQADYGSISAGFAASCAQTDDCYVIGAFLVMGAQRPVQHWDLGAREDTSGPLVAYWRLHAGQSFTDAPTTQPFYRAIETLLHNETTAGCAAGRYCPDDGLTRRQLALLLEGSRWGEFPLPFFASGTVFADVGAADPFAPWIERLAVDGVSAGCTSDPDGAGPMLPRFCPDSPVRRDQLAGFLLRMRMGPSFVPPPCGTQPYADVPAADPSCPWIRSASLSGYMKACTPDPDGAGPLLAAFCPANTATRAQTAGALARTFALELWSLGL